MKKKSNVQQMMHPCVGCHYWRQCGLDYCCNYIFVEGHMRGCPPGAECTKRIPIDLNRLRRERQEILQNMFVKKTIS